MGGIDVRVLQHGGGGGGKVSIDDMPRSRLWSKSKNETKSLDEPSQP